MQKKLCWFVHCPSVWDEDSRQDSPNRQAIAVWFWNRTANRETNRKHRNRTGTVHIHEPNRTEPNRWETEPFGVLRTAGIRLFSTLPRASLPEFVRWCSLHFPATFACAKINLAAEEKRGENGQRRETGKSNGPESRYFRLRLQNQGMELFPCPGLRTLRFMSSLANCTPPENTVCFFHTLEKANTPWKKQIRLHGDLLLKSR